MKLVLLGEVCTLEYGKPLDKEFRKPNGDYFAYGANGPISPANKFLVAGPCVIIGRKGSAGEITFVEKNVWPLDVTYYIKHDSSKTDLRYLYYLLRSLDIKQFVRGVKPGLNRNDVYGLTIPLPSLEKQREIVEKLDSAFAELHASTEMTNRLLKFSKELVISSIQEIYAERENENTEKLGDLLELLVDHRGKTPKKLGSDFVQTGVRIISAANITNGSIKFERKKRYISQSIYERWMPNELRQGDVILTSEAPLGEVAQVDFDGPLAIGQRLYGLRGKVDRISNDYLRYFLKSERGQGELRARETGATAIGIRQSELVQLQVPVIPIESQLMQIQILKEIELCSLSLSNLFERKLELLKELNVALLSEAILGTR